MPTDETLLHELDVLRDRIETTDALTDDERTALLDFDDELAFRRSEYSPGRRLKLLRHCTILAGESVRYDDDDLPPVSILDTLSDTDAAKDMVRWIHRTYQNPETNRDYRVALRMFGEHVTDGEGKPPSIEQISADTPNNYNPLPDPAKMLWWDEHILPMIEAARYDREKAAVALAWDLGARSGEFESLTLGDITDSKYGMRVTLEGKQGLRSPVIIPSVPYLQRWVSAHPGKGDPDAPLWSKLNSPEPISARMFLNLIQRPAEDAGITHTNINYRRMRKSSASYLASQNVSQAHLEDHKGWCRGSEVASRYIAVFAEANDREIARAHGVDVSADEPDPIAPVVCPRCDRETPREKPLCMWCSQALSPGGGEQAAQLSERILDTTAEAAAEGDLENVDSTKLIQELIDRDPSLRAAVTNE